MFESRSPRADNWCVGLLRSARRRSPDRAHETGFTLIELLVVIIILGILAAIAIPLYMHQRLKAYETLTKSDLRNFAGLEESYFVDHDVYASGANVTAALGAFRHSQGDTVTVVSFDTTGYCIDGYAAPFNTHWFYDSTKGGLQPNGTAACPTAYANADGVTLP